MFIESTFMRFGKSTGGLVGITLKQSALSRWALSLHACSNLTKGIGEMRDNKRDQVVMHHREESASRQKSDDEDRQNIRNRLKTCIDPLNCPSNADQVVNVVTSKVGPQSVNVDDAVALGHAQMVRFEQAMPEGFHSALTSTVVTMSAGKKSVSHEANEIIDTELIYSRVMALKGCRTFNLPALFECELAPIPTALFDDDGDMRSATSKSTMKTRLQVEVSSRTLTRATVKVLDGCALLWTVNWPRRKPIAAFIDNFWTKITYLLKESSVYLVFDRYMEYSIKSATILLRTVRRKGEYVITSTTSELPAQADVLTSSKNKIQLIEIVCKELPL